MPEQNQPGSATQFHKKSQPKAKLAPVARQTSAEIERAPLPAEPIGAEAADGRSSLAPLLWGPEGAFGGGSMENQVARLGDARLLTVQRQALAAEIGRVQGNRHLQRVVASVRGETKTAPYQSHTSKPSTGSASGTVMKKGAVGPRPAAARKADAAEAIGEEVLEEGLGSSGPPTMAAAEPPPSDGRPDTTTGGFIEAQAARLGDERPQGVQRRALAAQIGRGQGDGYLQGVVASAKGNITKIRGAPAMVMRAMLRDDTTRLATVNAAAAPLALRSGTGAGAASLGNLAAGDSVRILSQAGSNVRVHVETGALRGRIGYVPAASLTHTVPTSQRTPTGQMATVNAAAAPLALRRGTGAGATLIGNLAAGDLVRIIRRIGSHAWVYVETGARREEIGYVPVASLTPRGQMATVNAAAAPLALRRGRSARAALIDNLDTGDSVRILRWTVTHARVYVETGAQQGQIGYVRDPAASLVSSAAPTSVSEDAYAQLNVELNRRPPSREQIFYILQYRMTPDQLRRLLRPGDAVYVRLRRSRAISATDLLNILNICGAPLKRKLTEYLDRGGRGYSRLRLVFATANDVERLEVARDNALVGRLRPILGRTHPEIIFGTGISLLYPGDGALSSLLRTHPNLGRWLRRFVGRDEDIGIGAMERARGLRTALETMRTETPRQAHPVVRQAVNQAPRGMALSQAERDALDEIEELAYPEALYTSQNMGAMFVTRWGRPLRRASRLPKTFIHRLWAALKQLPQDNVLLNNVVTYFEENPSARSAGSYMDWLGNVRTHGRIRYDRPRPSRSLYAAGDQNSQTIEVRGLLHLDLFRRGQHVEVQETDGWTTVAVLGVNVRQKQLRLSQTVDVAEGAEILPTTVILHAARDQNSSTIEVREETDLGLFRPGMRVFVRERERSWGAFTVRGVNVPQRRLRLSQTVDVAAGAEIRATTASEAMRGEAIRITQSAPLFADSGNAPDTSNRLGTLQPGNLFSKMDEQTIGGTRYFRGTVYEGALRREEGWIRATAATPLGGGTTIGMEGYAWTVRHEMGHSIDSQIGGFNRFSAPSAAQWVKYPSVADWVNVVATAGGVTNAGTDHTFDGVTMNFLQAASTYSQAIQDRRIRRAAALRARRWLRGWQAAGGSQAVYDTITQFNANRRYFRRDRRGLPPLSDGRVYAAHYGEWFSFADAARRESLAAGVPSYAYTCSYEFFAEHYAAYTGPGVAPERYARAVPAWAQNFFDRLVGRPGAGPRVGTQ